MAPYLRHEGEETVSIASRRNITCTSSPLWAGMIDPARAQSDALAMDRSMSLASFRPHISRNVAKK